MAFKSHLLYVHTKHFIEIQKCQKKKKIIEVLIRFQIGLDPIMGAWNEPTISRLSNNL